MAISSDIRSYGARKPELTDPLDVLCNFVVKDPYAAASNVSVLFFDVPDALGSFPDGSKLKILKEQVKLFKLARSPINLLKKVTSAGRSFRSYCSPDLKKKSCDSCSGCKKCVTTQKASLVFDDVIKVISPCNQVLSLLKELTIQVSKDISKSFKSLNFLAAGYLSANKISENFTEFFKDLDLSQSFEVNNEKKIQAFLNGVQNISVLSIAILSAVNVFSSVTVPPLVMLAFAVTKVVFTLLPYYHKNIGVRKNFKEFGVES